WRTDVLDYKPFETWEEEGARDSATLANVRVHKLLRDYQAPALDPAINEALAAYVAQRKASEPDAFG
ncbi:MAG: trimethylamine methyltransferase family protein, partial [Rhodobacteraceae bacterium]|nr:trimethylamine methyltransferase family protein [Paracoccaceae bacterium]